MFYQPPRALGLLMGVVLAAWAFGIAIVLLTFGWGRPFDLVTATMAGEGDARPAPLAEVVERAGERGRRVDQQPLAVRLDEQARVPVPRGERVTDAHDPD